MYRIVRASIQYYDDFMKGAGARHKLVAPLLLLVSLNRFEEERVRGTAAYINLCDLVDRMKELFMSGQTRYHHFGMLLGELQALGFAIPDMLPSHITDPETLREQIDPLLQFLASRYPYDAYDNKTGVHNPKSNEFIFIQP